MNANSYQVGGTHYGGDDYQHWDWACEIHLPYLHGCASKYVARYRKKNGAEDLRKAAHYIDKAIEVYGARRCADNSLSLSSSCMAALWRFALATDLTTAETMICWYLMAGELEPAKLAVSELLQSVGEQGQGRAK